MLAKYKGTCATCGEPINVGDEISWSRRESGKAYHSKCREITVASGPIYIPSITTDPFTDPAKLLEQLKAMVAAAESKTAVTTETVHIPDDAAERLRKNIKAMAEYRSRLVKTNSTWYEVLAAILPLSNRILLCGPPSSGKSTTAMIEGNIKHRITMTETTSREDLIGMFHLIDGETRWVDGPFTTAMRLGEGVLVDEVDRYSPEAQSLFYSLIDDKPHISLPTGELVQAQEGYKVTMTTNETVETLTPAVQDRIEVIIMASTPHEAAISDMPKASQDVCMRYYKTLPTPQLRLLPTVRRMRMFHKLLAAGIAADISAPLVFGVAGAKEILSAITSAEGNK